MEQCNKNIWFDGTLPTKVLYRNKVSVVAFVECCIWWQRESLEPNRCHKRTWCALRRFLLCALCCRCKLCRALFEDQIRLCHLFISHVSIFSTLSCKLFLKIVAMVSMFVWLRLAWWFVAHLQIIEACIADVTAWFSTDSANLYLEKCVSVRVQHMYMGFPLCFLCAFHLCGNPAALRSVTQFFGVREDGSTKRKRAICSWSFEVERWHDSYRYCIAHCTYASSLLRFWHCRFVVAPLGKSSYLATM